MAWTKEQKQQIIQSFWAGGKALCPNDRALLDIKQESIQQLKYDILLVRCPRCGENFKSTEIEPMPGQVDDYNVDEKKHIVSLYFRSKNASCLRDATPLTFNFMEHSGGWNLLVTCPRCGRSFQWTSKDDLQTRP